MGFLADVGRSGGLRQLGNQYLQGQNELVDTALKLKQIQDTNKINDLREQKLTGEIEKARREEAEYNEPVDIRYTTPIVKAAQLYGGYDNPKVQELIKQTAEASGAVDFVAKRGRLLAARETLAKDATYMKSRYELERMGIENRLAKLIGKPNLSDDEKVELESLKKQAGVLSDSYQKWVKLNQEDTEPPKTREIKSGDKIITQQWEPKSNTWKDIATAPRYKPQEGGEDKTVVKENEVRIQLKEMLGLSDFLERAKDPELRKTFENASALASDIINSPEGYGLPKDAHGAAIAKRALDITRKMNASQRPPIESFDNR